jgi:hypothetical protein
VLVVGSTEHRGFRHLIILKPDDGAKTLLPEWMTTPESAAFQTVLCPRLSINKLFELRALLDRLGASSENQPSGGLNDETLEATRTQSVPNTGVEHFVATSTKASARAVQNTFQRDDVGRRLRNSKHGSPEAKR